MTDRYEGTASIPARMGVRSLKRADREMWTVVNPHESVCHHGHVRMAVHAMNADILGGWAADRNSGGDWVFTTDLSVRVPLIARPEQIDGHGATLRAGRTVISSSCEFFAAGHSVGWADVTYMRLARRHGDPPKVMIDDIDFPVLAPLDQPLPDAAGLQLVDPRVGDVRCELHEGLRNPAGAMQGAVSALMVEYAGEVLIESRLDGPHLATELDIRYLAMGRIGPMRTRATCIGAPEARTVRVQMFDDGNEGRICYTALLRYEPVPPGSS